MEEVNKKNRANSGVEVQPSQAGIRGARSPTNSASRFFKLFTLLAFNRNHGWFSIIVAVLDPVTTTLAVCARVQAASTLRCSTTTRAADLSSWGWHGLRASGSGALYKFAGRYRQFWAYSGPIPSAAPPA